MSADGSTCEDSVVRYDPSGNPYDSPVSDLYRDSVPQNEVWNEVSRETSTINVSGVEIERIDSVTFDRGNGKMITLKFDN